MSSGSSVIYDIVDEDIVAGVPAKSIKKNRIVTKEKVFPSKSQIKANKIPSS